MGTPRQPLDAAALEQLVQESIDRHQVPGAVVGVLQGSTLVEAAAGVTNLATGEAVHRETLFLIGSISKLWTTTLVMQLVDSGDVDLDAPVRRYLPELQLSDRAAADEITVRHLLSHTSGIDEDLTLYDGREDACVARYVERVAELPQLLAPGTLFSYCNTGMILAGRLVEVVSGQTYDQALAARLIGPLGLEQTVTLPEDAILQSAAVGHLVRRDAPGLCVTPRWTLPRASGPAGGTICTSARDLLTFAGAHLGEGRSHTGITILSAASTAAMQERQISLPGSSGDGPMGLGMDQGLGWRLGTRDGVRVIGHGGGNIGQYCQLIAVPERGVAIAILTNSFTSVKLHDEILTFVAGALGLPSLVDEPAPPASAFTEAIDRERYVGTYANNTGTCRVEERDGGLTLTGTTRSNWVNDLYADERPTGELQPLSPSEFRLVADSQYGDDGERVIFIDEGGDRPRWLHLGLYAYRLID
jgi:CubicO group peptidase (beta-lactamase class C family)